LSTNRYHQEEIMSKHQGWVIVLLTVGVLLTGSTAQAQHGHVMLNEADLKWLDAPPFLPPGAKIALLHGNPLEKDLFAIRVKLPANYKVAAHWHPTDEHVTVVSGTLYMGLGDKLDMQAAKPLKAGGFALVPAKKAHFVYTKEETVIQVYGIGPVEFVYVNPADDPRKAEKK
jgi:quercetin dioxygenase-like cupin family protein